MSSIDAIFTIDLAELRRVASLDPALQVTDSHRHSSFGGVAWVATIGGGIMAADRGDGGSIMLRVKRNEAERAEMTVRALKRIAALFGVSLTTRVDRVLVRDDDEGTGYFISALVDATEAV